MKKGMLKIFGTICLTLILILGCYNFCYADMVDIDYGGFSFEMILGTSSFLILIVFLALDSILIDTIKKQEKLENEGKERTISIENINNKRKFINWGFKFCLIDFFAFIMSIIREGYVIFSESVYLGTALLFIIYLVSKFRKRKKQILENDSRVEIDKKITKAENWLFIFLTVVTILELRMAYKFQELTMFKLIPIIVLVISIMIKFLKRRKLANIICFIAMISIVSINLYNYTTDKIREDFNNSFKKYIKDEGSRYYGPAEYVLDIKEFIEKIKENNEKNDRKVLVKYLGDEYVTSDELNNLSKIIGSRSNKISVATNYGDDKFIKEIKLGVLNYIKLAQYEMYEGEKVRGSNVKQLIKIIRNDGFPISVQVISDNNGKGEELNKENYDEILSKIQSSKTYKVEVLEDSIKITFNK